MSEHLFDPRPYGGASTEKRGRKTPVPVDGDRVDDDPRWRMIATVAGVEPYAHLLTHVVRGGSSEGVAVVVCGRVTGRAVPLNGTRPQACPTCRAKRARS